MRQLFLYIFLLMSGYCLAQNDSIPVYTTNEDSLPYKVIRLDMNSREADYSPFVVNNTLFFVSARPSDLAVHYSSNNSAEAITDLFRADKKDSLRFKNVSTLSAINTPYNEGPFTMSKDGHQIYYTANEKQVTEKGKTKTRLKILYSASDGKHWSTPVKPDFCKEGSAYGHPALSADQHMLVFCSDLPGGYGGMDLYASYRKDGAWSAPMNLGPNINSSAHELFPYVSDHGTLYFSSERANGFGGLDIYTIDLNDTSRKTPARFSTPVNSAFDDFGIWTDSLNPSGYFSSNRSGNDDIYYFTSVQPDFSKASEPVMKTKFCYTFFEETALETQDSVSFSYEWDLGDGTRSRELKTRHCYEKPGTYTVSLNAVEKITGEIFANQLTYELVVDPPPGLYIICADSVGQGNELLFNTEQCQVKDFELKEVYWDFGDERYASGRYVKHRYAKPGKYLVRLGVIAKHTETKKETLFKTTRLITIIGN